MSNLLAILLLMNDILNLRGLLARVERGGGSLLFVGDVLDIDATPHIASERRIEEKLNNRCLALAFFQFERDVAFDTIWPIVPLCGDDTTAATFLEEGLAGWFAFVECLFLV